jgi:hypothetical protein
MIKPIPPAARQQLIAQLAKFDCEELEDGVDLFLRVIPDKASYQACDGRMRELILYKKNKRILHTSGTSADKPVSFLELCAGGCSSFVFHGQRMEHARCVARLLPDQWKREYVDHVLTLVKSFNWDTVRQETDDTIRKDVLSRAKALLIDGFRMYAEATHKYGVEVTEDQVLKIWRETLCEGVHEA